MENTSSAAVCGICGLEARGRENKTLFGHVVHKKCKDKFVLNRELAWVIDLVATFMITGNVLRYVMTKDMTTAEEEGSVAVLVLELSLITVFLLKDSIRGISLGKLITGLQVIDVRNGEPIGPLQSLQRNLITLVPIAPIVLAFQMRGGPRFGEGWAHTRVIQRARRDQPAFAGAPARAEDWSSAAR